MAATSIFRQFLLLVILVPLTFCASDYEALLKFKKSLTNAMALDSWVPGSRPCHGSKGHWKGLVCNNRRVTGLRLEGMGLSGKIDGDALVKIPNLFVLSAYNNSFMGTIPEISRLHRLKGLFLSNNQFSGDIPPDFFAKMGSLKKVSLSNNKFTGNIPVSLANMSQLVGLHLENNQFSGPIPDFNIRNLVSFNVSNNKLEGGIPFSLSKFHASSFHENPGLCGLQVGRECNEAVQRNTRKIMAAIIMFGLILFLVLTLFAIRLRRNHEKNLNLLPRGTSTKAVEVSVSMPVLKTGVSLKSPTLRSSLKKLNQGNPISTLSELVMVNNEKGVFVLTDLMRASAEVLGNGSLGSSYKVAVSNEVEVEVKRIRQMNALGNDAFDAEVKRLGNLRHPNVLTPLAYHYRREEKLFVYEHLPKGSLLYHLHGDDGESSGELDWPTRLKIVRGIAEGLEYLHTELASLDVPHGNLKSSNVLLGPDYRPYLVDYGFQPLLNIEGLEALFAYKTPEGVQQKTVSPKSDVYCLGLIILEILTGEMPSQYHDNGNEGTDIVQWVASAFSEGRQAELLDAEIAGCRDSVGSMEKLLRVGTLCTETSPEQRLDIKEVIRMIKEIQVEVGVE